MPSTLIDSTYAYTYTFQAIKEMKLLHLTAYCVIITQCVHTVALTCICAADVIQQEHYHARMQAEHSQQATFDPFTVQGALSVS